MRSKKGLTKAIETLTKNPAKLGPLKGRSFILSNDERKSAAQDVAKAVERLNQYAERAKALAENSRRVDADKATRDRWSNDRKISRLSSAVGADSRENLQKRIGHECQVRDLTKGLSADELKALPVGTPLRRAAIAQTVDRLRNEAEERREYGHAKEPMPSITAGPREQGAFDAARDYSRARQTYIRELYGNAAGKRPVGDETLKNLETAANNLIGKHPEGVKYLSRFGVKRGDLIGDASKVPIRARAQDLSQRLEKLTAKFKETGQGVGAALSIFRRR